MTMGGMEGDLRWDHMPRGKSQWDCDGKKQVGKVGEKDEWIFFVSTCLLDELMTVPLQMPLNLANSIYCF